MQAPCSPYALPTGVDDGVAADADEPDAPEPDAPDPDEPDAPDPDEPDVPERAAEPEAAPDDPDRALPAAATVCPSVPSTRVTPDTVVERTAVAPGTAATTAFASASAPFGYSTTVAAVVVVSLGAPTTNPFAVSAAEAAVAPPGVEPPFCTDTCTLDGVAAFASV